MQKELVIVGGGSGTEGYIVPEAIKALEKVDCVIASERFLNLVKANKTRSIEKISVLLGELPYLLEKESIGIIVSGDPLMYSLYRTILKKYPELSIKVIAGISSLQILGAIFGLTMEDAAILSIHGRDCSLGKIAYTVSESPISFFFCSKNQGPKEIAKALISYNLEETELFVGANLTYPDEFLWSGKPAEFLEKENPSLCVAAVKNSHPNVTLKSSLLPDSCFFRNSSPMTKEEVRAVILSKLRLMPDSIVWDLGAGTGSISVECSRMCPFGNVYAVEYKEKALKIIKKNKSYFQADNLNIISGRAEEAIKKLSVPDSIFIGGSNGAMKDILKFIFNLPKKIRLVISSVTLETQSELYPLLKNMPCFEVIQMNISSAKQIGNYNVFNSNNPVMLFSCETKEQIYE